MATIPGPSPDWLPLSATQAINSATSVALTLPTPAGQTPAIPNRGYMYVGILYAQGAQQYVRDDGAAATASLSGGSVLMNPGDYLTIYGQQGLSRVRVIRGADGGALVIRYYAYRQQPA